MSERGGGARRLTERPKCVEPMSDARHRLCPADTHRNDDRQAQDSAEHGQRQDRQRANDRRRELCSRLSRARFLGLTLCTARLRSGMLMFGDDRADAR
jgi:hypothetical protein